MDSWPQLLFATLVVAVVTYFLNFDDIPSGVSKIFAYLGVALIPVTSIQVFLDKKYQADIKPADFMFAIFLNTSLVLMFSYLTVTFILEPLMG